MAYESLGQHQKAIEDYDKAVQESPDSPAVYRARSMARRNIGDQAGYEADRDKANSIDDRSVVIEFRTDSREKVFPMVAAGASNDDIITAQSIRGHQDEVIQ